MDSKFDVIIIGAGPAGISASLYAKRANLKVLVLYHGESQLEKAHQIENYYGFENGITGQELYRSGIQQAKNLGVQVIDAEVTNIQYGGDFYSVTAGGNTSLSGGAEVSTAETSSGSAEIDAAGASEGITSVEFTAPAVIIATGNKRLSPDIPGIKELEGKGVSYCAVCDGFFYRKKAVCVIGNQRYAWEEAMHLANMASSVTILTDGKDADELRPLYEAAGGNWSKVSEEKLSAGGYCSASGNGSKTADSGEETSENQVQSGSPVSKIRIDTRKISKICSAKNESGEERVCGVQFDGEGSSCGSAAGRGLSAGAASGGVLFDGEESLPDNIIPVDGVFVALGSAGGADFAKKLGLQLEGNSIKTDEKMQTGAPGIFACGNVNGGLLQVCKAVYEGGVAGLSAVEYVRNLKK